MASSASYQLAMLKTAPFGNFVCDSKSTDRESSPFDL